MINWMLHFIVTGMIDLKHSLYFGLPQWLSGKESACSAGGMGVIPGSGRSPWGGHSTSLQSSRLGFPVDREPWWGYRPQSRRVRHNWSDLACMHVHIYLNKSIPASCFPGDSEVKVSACNVGDLSSIPGSGRSPGGGKGNPLQYSCLENPMDRGAWWATVHGVTESRTRLSDLTLTNYTCSTVTSILKSTFLKSYSFSIECRH